uniref:Uncharacterized protein n=1 Tax=Rhizophora mucronata TaxID=61149 RepID=A0A2P2JXY6_RHIMU
MSLPILLYKMKALIAPKVFKKAINIIFLMIRQKEKKTIRN